MAVSAVITSITVGKEVYHNQRLHDINVYSRIFRPVSVVTAPQTGQLGFWFLTGADFSLIHNIQAQLWGPTSLIFDGYWSSFLGVTANGV
jgi:hypothetical protein